MNTNQVNQLHPGIYRLWWTEGGSSLAAVGMDLFGRFWYAPCNWVTVPYHDWSKVERAELIMRGACSCGLPMFHNCPCTGQQPTFYTGKIQTMEDIIKNLKKLGLCEDEADAPILRETTE